MHIAVSTERPTLKFLNPDGTEQLWSYDVVAVKLQCEALETQHGLRTDDKLAPPTTAFLSDLAAALIVMGMPECTLDLALRVYSLVAVQFTQLSRSIAEQVDKELL